MTLLCCHAAESTAASGGAPLPGSSTPCPHNSNMVDGNLKSELYDAPRRSLRQQGLGPEGTGFPYYSPSKQRVNTGESSNTHSNNKDQSSASERTGESSPNNTPLKKATAIYSAIQEPTHRSPTPEQQHHHLNNTSVRRQIIKDSGKPRKNGQHHNSHSPSPDIDMIDSGLSSLDANSNEARHILPVRVSPQPRNSNNRCSSSPMETAQVVMVDRKGLVEVFERIVKGTERCSVEAMERIHAMYEQLVFRHRMRWSREDLLEVSSLL